MSAPDLSGLTPGIPLIWELYKEASVGLWNREEMLLNVIATGQLPGRDFDRFVNKTEQEIMDFFAKVQDELKALVIFDLLSATEGRLRSDFEKRVEDMGDTSQLSHDFKVIAQYCVRDRGRNPHSLVSLIKVWAAYFPNAQTHIQYFNDYWPFRNWLAHGRWVIAPYKGKPLPPPEDVKDCVEGLLNDIGILLD